MVGVPRQRQQQTKNEIRRESSGTAAGEGLDPTGQVGSDFTYLSKIENDRLTATQFPGEETTRKLAKALDADEVELLLLAK